MTDQERDIETLIESVWKNEHDPDVEAQLIRSMIAHHDMTTIFQCMGRVQRRMFPNRSMAGLSAATDRECDCPDCQRSPKWRKKP